MDNSVGIFAGGVGYCSGGCAKDSDCKGAGYGKCQLETGMCVAATVTFPVKLGDFCNFMLTATPPTYCNCRYNRSGVWLDEGYCTQFCTIGTTGNACGAGYVCASGLPSAYFSSEPVGLAGTCLKTCATDADCVTYHTTCNKTYAGAAATGVCEAAL
ncbi:MAG: hypothetical protein ACHREM_09455 [Polyangiales bacterium]